jgi:hypothetical protein
MKTLFACFALLLFAVPCLAQEYLEPDNTPILPGDVPRLFGRDYGRGLKPALGNDARVFAVIEGGLVPDFLVGLKTVKDGYRIFMLGEKRGGGLDRCEAPITNGLARDIIIAWDKVLRQIRIRTNKPMGGADVPFEHFGSRLKSGLIIGRVWDTPPSSNPAHLGLIAGGLLQICSKGRVQSVPDALAEINTALSQIH